MSVDLDGIGCYYRIHGLGEAPASLRHVVLRRCLPRFAELFARHDLEATFFVVGSDLDDDRDGRALLTDLARDGHELANHTHTHPYDFTRLPPDRMALEIDRAHAAISEAAGRSIVGFRAPGYAINRQVLELLLARGYAYDSSVFPSPPYFAAKALVMGAMRLVGRRSASVLDDPRALLAPLAPYRVDAAHPYRRASAGGLLEIPIAVTPAARLHVIGTSLVLAPDWLRGHMISAALSQELFNLELHGIDLADAARDELPAELVARQPDLRRPLEHKLRVFDDLFQQVRARASEFVRLDRL